MTGPAPPADCSPERMQRALDILRSSGNVDEGLGLLWRCLRPQLLGFFRRHVRGSPEPDDLTQEVLLRVLGKGPTCPKDVAGLKKYLFKAARNAFIDHVEEQSRRWSLEVDLDRAQEEFSPEPSPEEQAHLEQWAQVFREALGQLSPGQHFCLKLYYYDGLNPAEIARLRGCSEGTVKALLDQGRKRLRALLKRDSEPSEDN